MTRQQIIDAVLTLGPVFVISNVLAYLKGRFDEYRSIKKGNGQ